MLKTHRHTHEVCAFVLAFSWFQSEWGAESWQEGSLVALADPILCNSIPDVTHERARRHAYTGKHTSIYTHTSTCTYNCTIAKLLAYKSLRTEPEKECCQILAPFSVFLILSEDQSFRSLLSDLTETLINIQRDLKDWLPALRRVAEIILQERLTSHTKTNKCHIIAPSCNYGGGRSIGFNVLNMTILK